MPYIFDKLVLAVIVLAAARGGVVRAEYVLDTSSVSKDRVIVLEGDILSGPKMMQKGIGVQAGTLLWEDGIVPYYISPDLQPFVVDVVEKAINTWNRVAGVSLVEIDPSDLDSPPDYLHFTPAAGCASWIGRQGGEQSIWTAPSCSAGSMMHEIGHALGLEHEHTRPDRDQHISIVWENISADKSDNFDISREQKQYYGAYDYASIMHYGEYFFSENGAATIVPLNNDSVVLGQRIGPSEGDVKAISMLYASDVSLVSNVVNTAGTSEVSLLVTNEYTQGANQLEIELQVGAARMLSNSNDEWKCSTYDGTLSCSLDRLQGETQSTLILILDQEMTELELNPKLASKSPDRNPGNNKGVFSPAAANGDVPNNVVQPYADQQLAANAGSLGYWMFGFLMMMLFNRRTVACMSR